MNGTKETEDFITTCHYFSKTTTHVSSFKSTKYITIRISNIVFLCLLIFPSVLLNATAAITIWKRPPLKKKLSCFVIFLNSLVDLGVGCIGLPIVVHFLLVSFIDTGICFAIVMASTIACLTSGLSLVTLFVLTMERYLGIVHPFYHRTNLTKKRVFTCVLIGVLTVLSIFGASFLTYLACRFSCC